MIKFCFNFKYGHKCDTQHMNELIDQLKLVIGSLSSLPLPALMM